MAAVFVAKNGTGSWIPYFKYKCCAFFAHVEGQDIPAKPKGLEHEKYPGIILGGVFRRELRKLGKTSVRSLAYSILMAKKGMPRADEELIRKAEEKMVVALTTPPKPLVAPAIVEGFNHSDMLDRSSMEAELKRTVRELFEGQSFTVNDMSKPFFPSTSANYNRSRAKMGAVGEILDNVINRGNPWDEQQTPLVQLGYFNALYGHKLSEKYGDAGKEESIELENDISYNTPGIGIHYNTDRLEDEWRKAYWKIFKIALTEEPLVEPVGLAEALKIRVISKGPCMTYTALKPLQVFLWKTLKDYDVFKLIGEPVSVEHIERAMGTLQFDSINEFVSGDYVASTDNLHSWVSETIAREIAVVLRESGYFSPLLEELFVRALTKHFC
nr:RNA-dependent RNA polymerase [Flumine narna-like virus 36]